MPELNEEEIQSLYMWIDEIPLSKPKKSITRDFSDGVAAAEVIKHFLPKLVETHNYPPANSIGQKIYNWTTLNQKVLRKLGYNISDEIIHAIVSNKPGYVEYLLYELRQKIEEYLLNKPIEPTTPKVKHSKPKHKHIEKKDSSKSIKLPPPLAIEEHVLDFNQGPNFNAHVDVNDVSKQTFFLNQQQPPTQLLNQPPFLPQQPQPQIPSSFRKQQNVTIQDPKAKIAYQLESNQNYYNRKPMPNGIQPTPALQELQQAQDYQQAQLAQEMRETIQILQLKIAKLEHLIQLKDKKIEEMMIKKI